MIPVFNIFNYIILAILDMLGAKQPGIQRGDSSDGGPLLKRRNNSDKPGRVSRSASEKSRSRIGYISNRIPGRSFYSGAFVRKA